MVSPKLAVPLSPSDEKTQCRCHQIQEVRSLARQSFVLAILLLFGATGLVRAQPSLPPPEHPEENPSIPEKLVLGKMLFWEEQFSSNNVVACATCHLPEFGGSDPRIVAHPGPDQVAGTEDDIFGSFGVPFADSNNNFAPHPVLGFETQITERWSPSVIMSQYADTLFWDGRSDEAFVDPDSGDTLIQTGGTLENQALGPPLSDVEMAHQNRTWTDVSEKLSEVVPLQLARDLTPDIVAALALDSTYPDLFEAAFGTPEVTAQRIAYALAVYQRSLVPDQTPFDLDTMTDAEQRGQQVFAHSHCIQCHPAPFFSDFQFHALALRPSEDDLGRQGVTGNESDRGKFKTPSLRNVGLRPRFMHNGEFASLRELVEFYNDGAGAFDNKDPLLVPQELSENDIDSLVEFLTTGLTDPRVANGEAPFDHPTLYTQWIENPVLYGEGTPGSSGAPPVMLATDPPLLGNKDFRIGVGEGHGGAPALLLLSAAPGSTDLFGVSLDLDLGTEWVLVSTLLTPGDVDEGYATLAFEVPLEPELDGISLFAQWLVFDPGASTNWAATKAAELMLFLEG